jgi:hypothetical protein
MGRCGGIPPWARAALANSLKGLWDRGRGSCLGWHQPCLPCTHPGHGGPAAGPLGAVADGWLTELCWPAPHLHAAGTVLLARVRHAASKLCQLPRMVHSSAGSMSTVLWKAERTRPVKAFLLSCSLGMLRHCLELWEPGGALTIHITAAVNIHNCIHVLQAGIAPAVARLPGWRIGRAGWRIGRPRVRLDEVIICFQGGAGGCIIVRDICCPSCWHTIGTYIASHLCSNVHPIRACSCKSSRCTMTCQANTKSMGRGVTTKGSTFRGLLKGLLGA